MIFNVTLLFLVILLSQQIVPVEEHITLRSHDE